MKINITYIHTNKYLTWEMTTYLLKVNVSGNDTVKKLVWMFYQCNYLNTSLHICIILCYHRFIIDINNLSRWGCNSLTLSHYFIEIVYILLWGLCNDGPQRMCYCRFLIQFFYFCTLCRLILSLLLKVNNWWNMFLVSTELAIVVQPSIMHCDNLINQLHLCGIFLSILFIHFWGWGSVLQKFSQ